MNNWKERADVIVSQEIEINTQHKSKRRISQHEFRALKQSGRLRQLDFDLNFAEFDYIKNSDCHYCGSNKSDTIDRINNNLGYISGNCVSSCRMCNCTKGQKTIKDWHEFCRYQYMRVIGMLPYINTQSRANIKHLDKIGNYYGKTNKQEFTDWIKAYIN